MRNNSGFKNIVFGIWPIVEALREAKSFNKILIQKGNKSEEIGEILRLCRKLEIPIQTVPVQKLNRITKKNHQGIIGFTSPIDFLSLEEVISRIYEEGRYPFLLILDRITDVRNFGAICRTAEAAGVDAIIFPEKESAMIGPDAIKTSAGAIFNLDFCREKDLLESVEHIKNSGIKIVSCTEKTDKSYKELDFKGPIALVMGSEEDGISEEILKISDIKSSIPMLGKTKSLNVSVACGILLYEIVASR